MAVNTSYHWTPQWTLMKPHLLWDITAAWSNKKVNQRLWVQVRGLHLAHTLFSQWRWCLVAPTVDSDLSHPVQPDSQTHGCHHRVQQIPEGLVSGWGWQQLIFEMLVLTSTILSDLSVVEVATNVTEWEQVRWLHGKLEWRGSNAAYWSNRIWNIKGGSDMES